MADSNDAVDRSQATIYQGKSGLKVEELIEMMDRETYMTGQEDMDKGFTDELIEGASDDIAASVDRRTLFVRNMPVWVSARKDGIPAGLNLPTVNTGENPETNINQPDDTGSLEGGIPMANERQEPQAEVNAAVPVVDTEAIQAAVQAEQQRIREIDEMSALYDSHVMRVIPKSTGGETLAPVSPADVSGDYAVRYWATYIDGKLMRLVDPFNHGCTANGKDFMPNIHKFLG